MIDHAAFRQAHSWFEAHVRAKSGGVPFVSFEHPFLQSDEIRYKKRAAADGERALELDSWRSWRGQPERIIDAVREACSPSVSQNLVEHRWGPPFTEIDDSVAEGLSDHFRALFLGGPNDRHHFGPRFDALADFLRANSISCQWHVMAYLAFLANPRRFFPIRPTHFEDLAEFYGSEVKIQGRVEWSRYEPLLDIAHELRGLLKLFHPADAIDIQSYMFVVAHLVREHGGDDRPAGAESVDWELELSSREADATNRERLGLLGERHVFHEEKEKLEAAGREDLASRVELVSAQGGAAGYDVLSFTIDGVERHLEVKSTARARDRDFRFWLSDNERKVASEDPLWELVRVYSVESVPETVSLGNIVLRETPGWRFEPGTWTVQREDAGSE
jgi:hypothetical protein